MKTGSDNLTQYAKMSDKGRLTVPGRFRRILGLKQGDTVMFHLRGTHLEIVPTAVVPRDQLWYYAEEVQMRVTVAEQDIAEGRTTKAVGASETNEYLDSLEE